jgi:membrane protein DedA with SNARE-associated domain
VILLKGFTPIPYKLVTIVSGFAGYNFIAFIVLSLLTRGARFLALAWILVRYGEQVRGALDRHLAVIVTALLILLVGGIVVALYLV